MPLPHLLVGLALPGLLLFSTRYILRARCVERRLRPPLERLWDRHPWSYEASAIVAGWLLSLAAVAIAAVALVYLALPTA